jgi:hypothetical protein
MSRKYWLTSQEILLVLALVMEAISFSETPINIHQLHAATSNKIVTLVSTLFYWVLFLRLTNEIYFFSLMYKESIYSQRTDNVQVPTGKVETLNLVIIWTMHINGEYVGTFFPLTLQLAQRQFCLV